MAAQVSCLDPPPTELRPTQREHADQGPPNAGENRLPVIDVAPNGLNRLGLDAVP